MLNLWKRKKIIDFQRNPIWRRVWVSFALFLRQSVAQCRCVFLSPSSAIHFWMRKKLFHKHLPSAAIATFFVWPIKWSSPHTHTQSHLRDAPKCFAYWQWQEGLLLFLAKDTHVCCFLCLFDWIANRFHCKKLKLLCRRNAFTFFSSVNKLILFNFLINLIVLLVQHTDNRGCAVHFVPLIRVCGAARLTPTCFGCCFDNHKVNSSSLSFLRLLHQSPVDKPVSQNISSSLHNLF